MEEEEYKRWHNKLSDKAKSLIQERRLARRGGGRSMKDISQELQKERWACERSQKRSAIERILSRFKGLQGISNIRNDGKKIRLTSVLDEEGVQHYGRQGIVDVFANFYEGLYKKKVYKSSGRQQWSSTMCRSTTYKNRTSKKNGSRKTSSKNEGWQSCRWGRYCC